MSIVSTRSLLKALPLSLMALLAFNACKNEPEHPSEEPTTGDEIEHKAKQAGNDIDEATDEAKEDVDESLDEAKD